MDILNLMGAERPADIALRQLGKGAVAGPPLSFEQMFAPRRGRWMGRRLGEA